MSGAPHSDFQIVADLGGTAKVAESLGLEVNVVSNWRQRGVPWRWRAAIAQLAAKHGVVPPKGFLNPGEAA